MLVSLNYTFVEKNAYEIMNAFNNTGAALETRGKMALKPTKTFAIIAGKINHYKTPREEERQKMAEIALSKHS